MKPLLIKNRKYELTSDTIEWEGVTLHRIKALRPFKGVIAGELGGYVEADRNLYHENDSWVADEAKVFGSANIGGAARVTGNAQVYGEATVKGTAGVHKFSEVSGTAIIAENACVSGPAGTGVAGNSRVYGYARVQGGAKVHGDALVFGEAVVSDLSEVCGAARVGGKAHIGKTKVCGDACVDGNFISGGGELSFTPICVQGSQVAVMYTGEVGKICCGGITRPVAWWEGNIDSTLSSETTILQKKEILLQINLVTEWMRLYGLHE